MKRNVVVIVVVVAVVAAMLIAGKYLSQRQGQGGALAGGAPVKGAPAPDFHLPALDGKHVKLSDLRGKAVLLNFWATWCGPCKIEMPWFVEFQQQYGPEGLVVVGVSLDEDAEENRDDIAKFTEELKVNYPILLGNDEVAELYGGVQALPTTFFIGRDGKIVNRVFGLVSHSVMDKSIKAALQQGQAVAEAGER